MSGELSADDLRKHKLSKMPTSQKDKLVGLFYDKDAKGRQEIITVPIYDVRPILDLDEDSLKELAQHSVTMDKEVIAHLIDLLTQK